MDVQTQEATRNGLLAALSPEDLADLAPHLEPLALERRLFMERPGEIISHVYFPLSGLGSIVVVGSRRRDQRIEAGIFGREGMSGMAVALGADRAVHEVYVQLPGEGLRVEAQKLREQMERRPSTRLRFLQFIHVMHVQTAHTALANGRDVIEMRLARWLLMAHDRLSTDTIELTHDFLSLMLGVRRPGVTTATHSLEGRGCIKARRGAITVIDREGLIATADGSYGAAEAEYERLIGHRVGH